MGSSIKAILAAAVVVVVAVAAAAAQRYESYSVLKDGLTIRKCDYPVWSSASSTYEEQLCNYRLFCVDDVNSPDNPWYLLQSRLEGKGDVFNKNYLAYEQGFGESLVDDFWLGLSCLHKMVAPGNNELLVRLVDKAGAVGTAMYTSFSVGLPSSKYQLHVEGFDQRKSNIGDSMNQSNGMKFTTYDQDNDQNTNRNCAEKYMGGWWYRDCKINAVNNFLNGYFTQGYQRKEKGVQWETWGTQLPVVSTLIVFRPQGVRSSSPFNTWNAPQQVAPTPAPYVQDLPLAGLGEMYDDYGMFSVPSGAAASEVVPPAGTKSAQRVPQPPPKKPSSPQLVPSSAGAKKPYAGLGHAK